MSRAPSVACPWFPIWVATPAARAALVSSRHSCKRMRERLLAIDVLARADGRHRRDGVDVVGRADRDGIDVLRLFVEHPPKIFVAPRLGKGLKRTGRAFVVNVAQRDDIGPQTRDGGDVAAAHAAGADARDVHSLARCDEARAAQDVPGHDREPKAALPAVARNVLREWPTAWTIQPRSLPCLIVLSIQES